jgi:ribosomal protein S18 acetylase RimI-like enzyme
MNGRIRHGTQMQDADRRDTPTTYYSRDSGVGVALRLCCDGGPKRVGVVGLGVGTVAAYGRAGDVIRFYEINPLVEPIARNLFTYIRDTRAQVTVTEGDGRASLNGEAPQNFNVLVVDAFSGGVYAAACAGRRGGVSCVELVPGAGSGDSAAGAVFRADCAARGQLCGSGGGRVSLDLGSGERCGVLREGGRGGCGHADLAAAWTAAVDGRLFEPAGGDALEVTLRGYRRSDLEAMVRLDAACFAAVFRFSRRAMRGFAEADEALTVIAEVASELAGFAIAEVADGAGYVVTVDVATTWRGRGLGRRLVQELERLAAESGAAAMLLHVHTGNSAAVRLYEALGYVKTGEAKGFYGSGLNAWVYERVLG